MLTFQEDCKFGGAVEMDLEVEPVPDIDGCDRKNTLAVVEYVEDIYAFYRRAEVNFFLLSHFIQDR